MNRLELIDIHKEYEGKSLLDGVNFAVGSGEILCLLGSSGSGKSTILRIIAGIENPDSGSVYWNGVEIKNQPAYRRNFGLMFQDYALFPHLNVAENIAFGLRMRRLPRVEINHKVARALERVNLEGFAERRVTDLSGGEQQRIALARALAPDPQLLMLDEPLAALDRSLRVELQSELRAVLHSAGIPVIYVTHDQEEALSISDRVVVMNQGLIEQVGPPFEIYNFPKTAFVAQFVGTLNSFDAHVGDPAMGVLLLADAKILVQPELLSGRRTGDAVKVALRPELIHIAATGAADENQLTGVVENVAFLGAVVRIHLRVGNMLVLVDEFNNPHLAVPAVGATLTCYFAREGCIVLASA